VSFETKQLLDIEVLLGNAAKLAAVDRFKTVMKFAHVFVVLVALLLSVFLCLGDKESNSLLYNIGAYGILAILIGFTVVWGWTLFKLYRDTKNSEKLLPAKKTFIVHGSLLGLFLVVFAFNVYAGFR